MKPWWRHRLGLRLATIVAAGLAIFWAVGAVNQRAATQRDKEKVVRMTQNMKTICIGRFLIDMPDETRFELRGPRIDGFDLSSFDEPEADFRIRLAQREAELQATPDRLGGNRNLESVRDVKTENGVIGKIFVYGYTVMEGTRNRGLEMERYRYEGVALEAMVHAQGMSFDLVAGDYDPDQIQNLPSLVAKLVPNPHNKIPTEPGFCIDRAWFRDPLTPDQGEAVMMSAELPSHPDIVFQVMLSAGNKPAAQSLLERSADTEARLTLSQRMRVTRLRANRRTIGGIPGDELVRRVAETNDAVVYTFWWEVAGTENNVLLPHVVFKMYVGKGQNGPVPSSLSEDAAMALWDKISSSIRLRPVAPPEPAATVPPPTPLGAYAWAGEPCPASGWWRCSSGDKNTSVLGGQRRYVNKGERMPQALLLPPQTLWEKFRRIQPSVETPTKTSWKLIDKRSRERVPSPLPLAQATPAMAAAMPAPQPVPLGSVAATGMPCPASGWWQCDDARALDAARWFALGSLLPPASFAAPPGACGRAGEAVRTIARRGTWRLVRLATSPLPAGGGNKGEST